MQSSLLPAPWSAADGTGPAPAEAEPADLVELGREARHRAVVRALDELPEPGLRLLAAMAVVDRQTPLPILAAVAGVEDAGAALEDLVEAGFVTWFPHGLTEPVGLDSRALRDVVYWNLPTPLRRAMHLASAEQLGGVEGLRHALLGTRRRDPELAARLEEEATRHHAAADPERAGTLLLWSADVSADRCDRERRLLQAARWGARTPTAGWAATLGRRIAALDPSVERNLFLGRLAAREARYESAHLLFEQARRLAADRPVPVRAAVELAAAALHADTGDFGAEERVASSLLAWDGLPREAGEWSRYFAADAHGRLHGSAEASLHRLESLAPELAAPEAGNAEHGILRWARGMWLVQSGRPAEAVCDLRRVLRSHDGPVEPVLPLAHACLGYAYFQLGDWGAALREAQEGIRAAEARSDRREAVPAAALAVCVGALRGDRSAAVERLDSVNEPGPAHYGVFPALAAARLAQARGEPGRMLAALSPVAAQPALFAPYRLWWRPLYVEALIGTGRLTAARTALHALREAARPTADLARLEARLAAAEHGPDAALEGLARAVEQAAGEDAPFAVAELEHDYGRLLLGARRRKPAIRWLLSAYDRYADLGARPYADRCLARLETAGVATGPGERGGTAIHRSPAALTRQQDRIARLAAEGLTNQQIAQTLFVSAKTVEYHLGNAFAKLGISSRGQLRAGLTAPADTPV